MILPQLTGLSFEASSILRRPCPQIQLDRHQVELTRNAALGKLKFCLSSFRAYPAGAKEARRHTRTTERAQGSVSSQPALLSVSSCHRLSTNTAGQPLTALSNPNALPPDCPSFLLRNHGTHHCAKLQLSRPRRIFHLKPLPNIPEIPHAPARRP